MLPVWGERIFQFILNPIPFPSWLNIIKTVFMVFIGFFAFLILYLPFKTTWFRRMYLWDIIEFVTFKAYGAGKMEKDWQKIVKRVTTGKEAEFKLSVMEADAMLSSILEKMGYGEPSLGQKLSSVTENILPNVEDVREAHQVRNSIVHDPDYVLSETESKRVLKIYEKAMQDLQAI